MNNITYEFYFNLPEGGKLIPRDEFLRFKTLAEVNLKAIIRTDLLCGEHLNEYRKVVCLAAEVLYSEKSRPLGVSSESTDGYSVTYKDKSSAGKEIMKIAALYLGSTGLLYMGVE